MLDHAFPSRIRARAPPPMGTSTFCVYQRVPSPPVVDFTSLNAESWWARRIHKRGFVDSRASWPLISTPLVARREERVREWQGESEFENEKRGSRERTGSFTEGKFATDSWTCFDPPGARKARSWPFTRSNFRAGHSTVRRNSFPVEINIYNLPSITGDVLSQIDAGVLAIFAAAAARCTAACIG